jgi:anaerobic selenocysteine-containing dehydrogenase
MREEMATTKFTFCRICEATCGVKVTVEGRKLIKVEPDPDHVVTKGYACVKGTRYPAMQNSPDRVTAPIKRLGDQWQEISWDQAFAEIGAKIKALRSEHGDQTIGHFVGGPAGANVMGPMFRNAFFEALGSNRFYGTPTTDCTNKFRGNEEMYGASFRLAFPDANHTEFLMVIGANPSVSGNSLYHLPDSLKRMREIVKQGGRVVFVNPRRTESSRAGEQVFIRPDTDLYFLAAFCNEWIGQGGVDEQRVEQFMNGYDTLKDLVKPWTAERQEAVTGIPASKLRELVSAHRAADGAALYMSTGVNQGRSGSLCFWLLESINAISGNLDRRGGTLMGQGMFDMAREMKEKGQLLVKYVRDDGLPCVVDNHPSGLLANDILNDRTDRLTALIVEASNPLLACSNPSGRLDEAFRKLKLLVVIDLFRNEVGSLAHYILPATTFMERADIPYALQSFAGNTPTRYMTYSDPVLEPPEGVRHEWWIFSKLGEAAGVTMFGSKLISAALRLNTRLAYSRVKLLRKFALTPEKMIDGMLKKYGLPGRKAFVNEHPHGILLEENQAGSFLGTDRVLTEDGKVRLAPKDLAETFKARAEDLYQDEMANRDRLKLIGKREMRTMNSSMSNSPELVKDTTNYIYMHPEDAERAGVSNDDLLEVRSAHGRITIPVRVTDEMMPRAVAIPQCWGHARADGLRHAQKHAGVNSNLLAGDGYDNIEKLSGMSHLAGIVVDIRKVEPPSI